jgi:hypothetical protein
MDDREKVSHDTQSVSYEKDVLDEVEQVVEEAGQQVEKTVAPIRQSLSKRFPTLFILLVTFGVTATLTGMEQILIQIPFLYEHPISIVAFGIVLLVLTGRLYKKFG